MTSRLQRRSPRSARTAVLAVTLGLCAPLVACGPRQAPRSAAPVAAVSTSRPVGGPPAPQGGLAFPSLAVAWTPPMLTAGDPWALAAALGRGEALTLAMGPRLAGAAWEQRGAALVAALSPATRVSARRSASLLEIVEPSRDLKHPRRSLGSRGRPHYAAVLRLHAAWPKGQVLAIDDAEVEAGAWESLPAVSVGSCEPAMQALALGQERALAQLGPFLDHADALLWRMYRAELRAFVPGFMAELAGYAQARPPEDFAEPQLWAQHQCGRAYREQVLRYAKCDGASSPCPEAPRLVLVGGARIAAVEPRPAAGEHCPALVGRDYSAELRRLGQSAAEAASGGLSSEWTMLADRLGALTEVHATLEDLCTPRRRRFAEADLEEARRRLTDLGAGLASDVLEAEAGRWQIRDEAMHVPGLGAARELARFVVDSTAINAGIVAEARALREYVLERSLCRPAGAAAPLALMLAEQPGAGASFFSFFYEEELFCGALPPLGR
jgi:hypothetical protein